MIADPLPYTRDEFPESGETAEGMRSIRVLPTAMCVYHENIIYARRGDTALKLQLLLPDMGEKPAKPLPCVIYIQGSAWFPQKLYVNIPQLVLLARRGFAVASVEYTPSTVAKFPAQIVDTKAAVRYMKLNAEKYGLDAERFIIMGDSSGGHTAVMVGITGDGQLPCDDYPQTSASVRAIVDYYGPTDISQMCKRPSTIDHVGPKSPEGRLIGNVNVIENPALVKPAIPMNYICRERNIPPVLILHGNKDRLVPFNQSIIFYEKLRAEGKRCEFFRLEGAGHGGGEFWCDRTLDIVEEFIRKAIEA